MEKLTKASGILKNEWGRLKYYLVDQLEDALGCCNYLL